MTFSQRQRWVIRKAYTQNKDIFIWYKNIQWCIKNVNKNNVSTSGPLLPVHLHNTIILTELTEFIS